MGKPAVGARNGKPEGKGNAAERRIVRGPTRETSTLYGPHRETSQREGRSSRNRRTARRSIIKIAKGGGEEGGDATKGRHPQTPPQKGVAKEGGGGIRKCAHPGKRGVKHDKCRTAGRFGKEEPGSAWTWRSRPEGTSAQQPRAWEKQRDQDPNARRDKGRQGLGSMTPRRRGPERERNETERCERDESRTMSPGAEPWTRPRRPDEEGARA